MKGGYTFALSEKAALLTTHKTAFECFKGFT